MWPSHACNLLRQIKVFKWMDIILIAALWALLQEKNEVRRLKGHRGLWKEAFVPSLLGLKQINLSYTIFWKQDSVHFLYSRRSVTKPSLRGPLGKSLHAMLPGRPTPPCFMDPGLYDCMFLDLSLGFDTAGSNTKCHHRFQLLGVSLCQTPC